MSSAASAVAGAAGSVAGGITQGYFDRKASSAGRRAGQDAQQSINEGRDQALGYLSPYRESGNLALSPLTGLLTGKQYDPESGKTTALDQTQRNNLFQTSPGYQFRLDQGQKALERTQVAKGGLLSGGAAKEALQYGQGAASGEYGNYINQLFNLAGMGQNAAGASANTASNSANSLAQYRYASGMNTAQGYANQGKIYGNMFSQLGAYGSQALGGSSGASGGGMNSPYASGGGSSGSTGAISPDMMSMGLKMAPMLL
jgi:hypothetical protein